MAELAADPAQTGARYLQERMLIPRGKDARGIDHFDCRLFDPVTRLCTEYDRRPRMCRDFPTGQTCDFCTYDARRPDVAGVVRTARRDGVS